jgi:hypothetical protein
MRPGRKGEAGVIVYRREPGTILCVACADRDRVPYRPSLRWERERKRTIRTRRGPAWMREAA